ncbi:mbkB [Pseudomonas sp. FSL R10-1339]|nr:mbkB [Pseudomonas sp. FSL R10-1339]
MDFHRDENGQFIILPKGMKAVSGWTFENGSRQAVKLEK